MTGSYRKAIISTGQRRGNTDSHFKINHNIFRMNTIYKILLRINWTFVSVIFIAMTFVSCSKDVIEETDGPNNPPDRVKEIPEWVKRTGFYLIDDKRGVDGYAVMYDL